jgi:drug/metabolite transporter (DMT)-like permease
LAFKIRNRNNLIGVIWITAWAFAFSSAMALIKFIGHDVPTAMKVFMRLLFGFMFFTPFLFKTSLKSLATTRLPSYGLRTILIVGSMFCTYYAYAHLPLAFATSIGFTAPLMTTLLAIIFLHERVTTGRWIALFVGYAGVLVMVRPGFVEFKLAVGVALLANIFASGAIISLKDLTKTDSPTQIMFYGNVLNVVVTAVIAFFNWRTPTIHEIYLLIGLGAIGVFSQYSSVKAYQYSQPSFLAPFEYLRLVFAIPIGYYLFDESPDLWALIGSFIIIATVLYMTFSDLKRSS